MEGMSRKATLGTACAALVAIGCSHGNSGNTPDAPCTSCDASSGVDGGGPKLEKNFPPYGLSWTPTGDMGRAGGLTWAYTGIDRGSLVHIWWLVCDDPLNACGLSMAGPIDRPTEAWLFDASRSDLPNGTLAFTDTTRIALADGSFEGLPGRLTINIVDASSAPVPFAGVSTLGIHARAGQYGAEITGTAFTVTLLGEVQDPTTQAWTPYLDYYDAQPTPDTGGPYLTVDLDGAFYDD
jgi:hypothetical protein